MTTARPRPQANLYQESEHPFAQYVRIIGKGKRTSRSLSYQEALHAFGMILDGEVLDVQLGAFLMLLRIKEESAQELAGFVQATKNRLQLPALAVDIDWPSYAGKRRHYPWFLLAALTLAQHGHKVVMHGAAGHTLNRLYTQDVLPQLGYRVCPDLQAVQQALHAEHFAYMPLALFAPRLAELIAMRHVMGLRTPVHTLSRLINPFNAAVSLQAIFHPAYRQIHQQAALQLGYQQSVVIKGEGGEFERNPDARTLVVGIRDGEGYELEWPMLNAQRSNPETCFDLSHFLAVWRGTARHDYGEKAVIGTLAIALYSLKKAACSDEAMQLAQYLWSTRQC